MKIIVNDANILIDLVDLQILPYFFELSFEFHTTELILGELFPEQKNAFIPFIETGKMIIDEISEDDLLAILDFRNRKPSLSLQDFSAFYQAKKANAALLTSDNKLRKFAQSYQMEVHGHLWIFDNLFINRLLSGHRAIEKLNELCNQVNPKLGLPHSECQNRIRKWGKF